MVRIYKTWHDWLLILSFQPSFYQGEDLREGSSPSWFNAVEALQVMKYLQLLTNNDIHQLNFDDIGIITPYRKQVGVQCVPYFDYSNVSWMSWNLKSQSTLLFVEQFALL